MSNERVEADVTPDARQRILDSAGRNFLERGYEGASMSRIARGAGVSTALLYFHYETKERLCYEFLRRVGLSLLEDVLRGVADVQEPEDRLREYVRAYITHHIRVKLEGNVQAIYGYGILYEKLSPELRKEIGILHDQLIGELRRILKQGIKSGTFKADIPLVTAYSILGVCELIPSWYDPKGTITSEELITEIQARCLDIAQYELG